MRWAIDAGAGLILPSVVMRGKDPGQLNVGGEKCLDVWWDLSHLDGALGANCPQMKLRAACPADGDNTVAIPPPKAPSIPPLKPAGRQYMEGRWSKGTFREKVILPALARCVLMPLFHPFIHHSSFVLFSFATCLLFLYLRSAFH